MKVTSHWSDLLSEGIYWVRLTPKGQRRTGRTSCDYRGRDWSNVATSQERQDQQPPAELGGGKEGCYPESQREQGPGDTLISNLWTLEL